MNKGSVKRRLKSEVWNRIKTKKGQQRTKGGDQRKHKGKANSSKDNRERR